nr:immunoglobulin heavy chain junction region [Mus musculus]NSM03812.1 immunoglobulin heavy chain junction region [Mus musculus]NSM03858.1 immunoglobulin heavy chain junction region [Mus musculus]NSM03931.1 immunoglobulin heavy chain junction region [Mus musculus]NSM03989.1 immunoglobulin heavy chain junction region [Mus musculus]
CARRGSGPAWFAYW